MFKALRYRQEVRFRHDCYIAGINAADYRNAHRIKDSDRIFSPLDYTTGESTADPAREEAKQNIASAYAMLLMTRPFLPNSKEHEPLTMQETSEWRSKVVRDLVKQGWGMEEAHAIFDQSFTKE